MFLIAPKMGTEARHDADFEELCRLLAPEIPKERLIRDPMRRFAYGADASFYRLIPRLVVRVQSEREVVSVLRACACLGIPYTFRAAGTSLSGQALSDSVLIQISRLWNGIHLNEDGTTARLEPAALGGDVNRALAQFQRKIGPDPASIDSAMIAGIAANNASGMCCGNIQDTYHTIASARIVFGDGSVLDTSSQKSWQQFRAERGNLVSKIDGLACRVRENTTLSQRIRHKYRIKNTTGYSLHALVDFVDPLDVITHLLVGSEGTLGFISEITYCTVADPPLRATSLILFNEIRAACDAAYRLSKSSIAAVELMDRQSLRSVENKPGIPGYFRKLDQGVTALLIEVRGDSAKALQEQIMDASEILSNCDLLEPLVFTEDQAQSKRLWEIRKGLFPSLGYARQNGTTIIIEDIAVPPENLDDAVVDLRQLFELHGYSTAVIFGHALQGNLHFVFSVDFNLDIEVRKYAAFLEDITRLVTEKYDGSLKAEHGTGRNMAPFVEREWGHEAFGIMQEIKHIFDPQHLMNPDVILSDHPLIHVSNLKNTPPSHPAIEKCTECGFCERTCPSRHLSLTPRQRIVAWREISRLTASGEDPQRLKQLGKAFQYAGDQTCAVDGLCATLCPLGIDTGVLIKDLRDDEHSSFSRLLADVASEHLGVMLSTARSLLRVTGFAHELLGTSAMNRLTKEMRTFSGNLIPAWNQWLPKPSSEKLEFSYSDSNDTVIYFPSCVSRLFGASADSPYADSQISRIENLLKKAGYSVVYPTGIRNLCCGMAFSSKGFTLQGDKKMTELMCTFLDVSQNGRFPILIDTSPCAQRLKEYKNQYSRLRLYDIAEFLMEFVISRISIEKQPGSIAVHVPCSLRKSAQADRLIQLAKLCAENVCVPESTDCCGFAGDRGFTHPELTASALVSLKPGLSSDCQLGYSSSRTCEIGASQLSGISYQSIAYLVDDALKET